MPNVADKMTTYKINECGKRPWGHWKVDEIGDGFIKKTITVNPGASLSLQSHEHRSEKWTIIDGIAEVTVNESVETYKAGDTVEIPQKAVHRLKNIGTEVLIVKETQLGDILDEADIVRYDDAYGRVVAPHALMASPPAAGCARCTCNVEDESTKENARSASTVTFVADMDGTLTPARLPMTEEFADFFEKFLENRVFYIVSGSDLEKIKEQVPARVLNKIAGIYCSMGNELHQRDVGSDNETHVVQSQTIKGKCNWSMVYQNDFTPEPSLMEKLEEYRKNTAYPHELYPNYIEKRRGMVNFSVLGRDCPQDARVLYKAWDDKHREREAIAEELSKLYPQYDISVGGNISIDIVRHGFGKDQVADHLRKRYKTEKIIFFGDRTEKGGNDYALAQRLLELGNAQIIAVDGPVHAASMMLDPLMLSPPGEEKMSSFKLYIVSGGFDPIHEGHIEMIKDAARKSDGVIVLLNSDEWLCRKKGKNFMNFKTRRVICENLKGVVDVLEFNDDDGSACDGIRKAREKYPKDELVFANGGDRTKENIPEESVCKECNVQLEFGIGGDYKANSSSWILKEWK
ncbi:hypothetical protein FACS1894122_12000 [Alphaproteobacteria bacterium]|nr:hypothetical protein FACS1894122_12000 [Alphaproteobacteria bacterium]